MYLFFLCSDAEPCGTLLIWWQRGCPSYRQLISRDGKCLAKKLTVVLSQDKQSIQGHNLGTSYLPPFAQGRFWICWVAPGSTVYLWCLDSQCKQLPLNDGLTDTNSVCPQVLGTHLMLSARSVHTLQVSASICSSLLWEASHPLLFSDQLSSPTAWSLCSWLVTVICPPHLHPHWPGC